MSNSPTNTDGMFVRNKTQLTLLIVLYNFSGSCGTVATDGMKNVEVKYMENSGILRLKTVPKNIKRLSTEYTAAYWGCLKCRWDLEIWWWWANSRAHKN